jgi:hypothetical protein
LKFNFLVSLSPNELLSTFVSFLVLACTFIFFVLGFVIFYQYITFLNHPLFAHRNNFKNLLRYRDFLIKRVIFLKKVYHSVVQPSKSFLGDLNKNPEQFKYISEQVCTRDKAIEILKELIVLEEKLKGEKPFSKSDFPKIQKLAFSSEFDRLIQLFTIKKK